MATSTATAQPVTLGFDRRAFLIAAAVSVASTVILFAFLALVGIVTAVAGLAAWTRGSRRARTLLGVGGGLLVGPFLYLALAVVVNLAG
ncbi:MAG: hypothetical protein AB7J47_23850 [Acidimicrobiia bacterium]